MKDLFCLFHIFQERKSTKIFFACLTFLERKSDNYHIYAENKISSRVRDTIGKCSEKKILFLRRMVDRERCISIQFHMTPSEKCGMNGTGCLLVGQTRWAEFLVNSGKATLPKLLGQKDSLKLRS